MQWIENLFSVLFGCWHRHLSFPITVRRPARFNIPAARQTGTYVVCLDCGSEFPYDWEQMHIAGEDGVSVQARKAERVA